MIRIHNFNTAKYFNVLLMNFEIKGYITNFIYLVLYNLNRSGFDIFVE